ncbi:imidazole glycerol phosphate synthase subunit HisH [Glaciecola petra]|uniref:Imidazole glycerol phosphate synthase subunit HisH n=1 Tax=Glaciecola petra TaxID=3075602 RepID=A0ABU2ZQ46_9ALTE|nr:imidazole glycerol phosphate synthase subunit HisH [Aestuariibacter sp. P117]MDT0594737.1 imidazole glycerol phosphate synthase subunit HisH [Aestuariibacter sp. P117]
MSQAALTIVDTGCANIASVKFAVERLGIIAEVSDDIRVIAKSQRVILPGVGSAPAAMKSIHAKNLKDCLLNLTQPVLGVCLGMQLMVEESQECDLGKNENTQGLGLMPGTVEKMQVGQLRLPHMGWNKVHSINSNALFDGIDDGAYFYFVHGYAVPEYEYTLAVSEYAKPFSAAINKDNFFGVQFHPERSSDAGAQLLKNFSRL